MIAAHAGVAHAAERDVRVGDVHDRVVDARTAGGNNALKQINVQQVSRYDALQALIKLTREYASYEAETLEKVIAQRKISASANPTVEEINANEKTLQEVSAKLIAIAEQYPDLKANQNYQQAMQDIKQYEENVRPASSRRRGPAGALPDRLPSPARTSPSRSGKGPLPGFHPSRSVSGRGR